MALVIMGGLVVATLLTLFFLPALYALWYRVPRQGADAAMEQASGPRREPHALAAE
jgi:multidrug efflux pump